MNSKSGKLKINGRKKLRDRRIGQNGHEIARICIQSENFLLALAYSRSFLSLFFRTYFFSFFFQTKRIFSFSSTFGQVRVDVAFTAPHPQQHCIDHEQTFCRFNQISVRENFFSLSAPLSRSFRFSMPRFRFSFFASQFFILFVFIWMFRTISMKSEIQRWLKSQIQVDLAENYLNNFAHNQFALMPTFALCCGFIERVSSVCVCESVCLFSRRFHVHEKRRI